MSEVSCKKSQKRIKKAETFFSKLSRVSMHLMFFKLNKCMSMYACACTFIFIIFIFIQLSLDQGWANLLTRVLKFDGRTGPGTVFWKYTS